MARPRRSVATEPNAVGDNLGAAEGVENAPSAASGFSAPSGEIGTPVILPLDSESPPVHSTPAIPIESEIVPHQRAASVVKSGVRSNSSLTGTLSAAGGGGAALLAFANGLKEPYKTWVPYLVPTISAYIAWGWPIFEAWSKDRLLNYLRERKKEQAVKVMKKALAGQQLLLKDDSLSLASQTIIKRNIETLQQAIAVKAFESIEYHLDA